MSFYRFVYYSAVIGGWAALAGWLVCEVLFLRGQRLGGVAGAALTGAVVGAIIGGGLNLVAGMTNAQWKRLVLCLAPGLVGGSIGGAAGALVGALTYSHGLPRALGWMIMGVGIGGSEGISERSLRKIRNGLIGGAIGGLVGGLLFDPIHRLVPASLGSFSRATAFVILGISIGALVGLAQVVLKEAWLTVVDGFRPGRQLILSQTVTTLGRGDHLPLPFLGYSGRDLESEHLRIARQPDGTYLVEDNNSRVGTRVNGRLIAGPAALADGDLIKLGTNIVRFNHRHRGKERVAPGDGGQPRTGALLPPPPPPAAGVGTAAGTTEPATENGLPPVPPGGQPSSLPGSRPPISWVPQKPPALPGRPKSSPKIPPPPPPPEARR